MTTIQYVLIGGVSAMAAFVYLMWNSLSGNNNKKKKFY